MSTEENAIFANACSDQREKIAWILAEKRTTQSKI